MYLTYEEYQRYGGTLDEAAFEDIEFKARGIINRYTYNRLLNETVIPAAVKRVIFSLINLSEAKEKAISDGSVASQSNDGVSVTFNTMSADNVYQNLSNQEMDIVLGGLSGVRDSKGHRLLYKGMYPDE